MENLIEPNWHPLIVHFVIAFLLTSPILLFFASLSSTDSKSGQSIQAAGDWMLFLGFLFALLAVAAGLQAYYSVAHDTPSHTAMTTHRNMAFGTVGVITIFALWRWTARSARPSKLFALLFLLSTLALGATGWKGGQLVYRYGLGVSSLPAATGDGHDHDHGETGETSGDQVEGDAAGEDDHSGGSHDENHDDGHDHGGAADNAAVTNQTTEPDVSTDFDYPETPEGVVDAFAAALRTSDETAVRTFLAPNVVIAEGGGAERSIDEYAGHHMPADMAFTAAVDWTMKNRDSIIDGNMATIITESQIHGSFNGQTIHSRMMESMILINADDQWRIVHIHWSSAPITGDHEH